MKPEYKIAESMRFKKSIINFSVSIIIILTTSFIVASLLQGTIYTELASENAIIIKNSWILNEDGSDFSYYIKSSGEPIKDVFTTQIKKSDIEKLNEEYITIFTPKMQCEAFEMFLNGKSIAVEGDIENYNSNIWTQNYAYTMESSLFDRESNQLKIVQYSRYLRGGLGFSFIIDGYQKSILFKNFKAFDIHQAIYGISIFMFLLSILMVSLFAEKRRIYYIMIASLAFMMIGYIEYFGISNLGYDFLLFKKIIVTSNLLAVGLGTIFFRQMFNKRKHNSLILFIYSAVILIPTFFSQDMITYKTIYTVLTFAILPIIFYWGFLSIKYFKKYTMSKVLLALALATTIYIFIWNISEVTQAAYMNPVTVVVMPEYIITLLTLILTDMHELRMDVANSNRRFTSAYKKSIADGLTKLFNASYMKEVIMNANPTFVLVVYDVDDFKNINDTYGHVAGDETLVNVSNEISQLLRNGDIMGRYGGDEFILLLKLGSVEIIKTVLERIRKKIEDYSFEFEGKLIRLTISMGFYIVKEKEDYKSILNKADIALYRAKKNGKNRIEAFDEAESAITLQE